MEGFTFEKGVLRQKGHIYVPDNKNLQWDILAVYHNHPLRGHPGEKKTKRILNQVFFRKGSSNNVQ